MGGSKRITISALISKSHPHLLCNIYGDSLQGLTTVPVKVSYNDQYDIAIEIYPIDDWKRKRCDSAKILLEKLADSNPLTSIDIEAYDVITALYGDIRDDELRLRLLALEEFEDHPLLVDFLGSPRKWVFQGTEDGLRKFKQSVELLSSGPFSPLLDHLHIRGRFDLPPHLVLVDLPGIGDAAKSKKFQQKTTEFLSRASHVLFLTDMSRVLSSDHCVEAIEIVQNRNLASYTHWIVAKSDVALPERLQLRKEKLKELYHLTNKVIHCGK